VAKSKPLSAEKANQQLQKYTRSELNQTLKRLPENVNVSLALAAVFSLYPVEPTDSVWHFARQLQQLPASVIRAMMEKIGGHLHRASLFLVTTVSTELPDDELKVAWAQSLLALLDMNTSYDWGSKQRLAKLRALAKSPLWVRGIQTAVVGIKNPSLDMLAVLAIDGSDESVDALIPHFDASQKDKSQWLDSLMSIEKFAKTPALKSMMALAKQTLQERNDSSPALTFARELGFTGNPFEADTWLGSIELNRNNVQKYQGSIQINSTSPSWFSVHVSHVRPDSKWEATSFGAEKLVHDHLNLGRCDPKDLPQWLRDAQEKLKIKWNTESEPRGTLRGKKRTQFADWLFGPSRK
jgi:hypothetical protein